MDPLRDALVIGDVVWLDSPQGNHLGGWATSFALELQKLGVRAHLASGVGNDSAGERAVKELQSRGLDLSLIGVETRLKTNTARVHVGNDLETTYETLPIGASDGTAISQGMLTVALKTQLVYYNSFTIRAAIARACVADVVDHSPQAYKVFDLRFAGEFIPDDTPLEGLRHADLIRISLNDLGRTCEVLALPPFEPFELCQVIVNRYEVPSCVITDPVYGITATSDGEDVVIPPPPTGTVTDRSGEWHEKFLANFLAKKFQALPLLECCQL
jgi:fructokinase